MKLKGVVPEVKPLKPGPPKLPSTFCVPCATKITASARRMGTVAKVEEVAISLLNILIASLRMNWQSGEILTGDGEKDETQDKEGIIYHLSFDILHLVIFPGASARPENTKGLACEPNSHDEFQMINNDK